MRIQIIIVLTLTLSCLGHTVTQSVFAQAVEDEFNLAEGFGEELEEEYEEEEDELESDRDSFTRSPRLMAPCRTMVEASYLYLDQDAEFDGHVYPDLLVRRGVNELLELRLGWTYEDAKFHHLSAPGSEPVREGLINYGAKVCITEACGSLPDSSLIITGYSPTSGESNDTDFSLEYVFSGGNSMPAMPW